MEKLINLLVFLEFTKIEYSEEHYSYIRNVNEYIYGFVFYKNKKNIYIMKSFNEEILFCNDDEGSYEDGYGYDIEKSIDYLEKELIKKA